MRYQDGTVRPGQNPARLSLSKSGLTIVEMVISLAIMAIVFATLLPGFRALQNSWDFKAGAAEALQNGRVLMDHLFRNLSKAVRITAVSGPADTDGYIEFEDNEGDTLRYDINADGYVEFGPVGNLSELAGPVSQLQFTCYDAYDLYAPKTDVDVIRSVKFRARHGGLNLSELGQDMAMTSQAYLRTNAISFGTQATPGVAVSSRIEVEFFGRIDSISGKAVVSTNSTSHSRIRVEDIGVIDGDVFVGPGGDPDHVIKLTGWGQITGSTGVLSQAVDIPLPSEPSLGGSVGNRTYYGFWSWPISSDLHCDRFRIKDYAKVEIYGDVTILVEEEFEIEEFGQIELMAAATLTLYTKDNFEAKDHAAINVNTADPSRFMINHLCGKQLELEDSSRMYATVVAPYAQLYIRNMAQFYGSFMGEKVKIKDHGRLYAESSSTMQEILP